MLAQMPQSRITMAMCEGKARVELCHVWLGRLFSFFIQETDNKAHSAVIVVTWSHTQCIWDGDKGREEGLGQPSQTKQSIAFVGFPLFPALSPLPPSRSVFVFSIICSHPSFH